MRKMRCRSVTAAIDVYPTSYYNKSYMWPALKAHWRTKDNSPATGFDQARIEAKSAQERWC
jgi:hypothetical protein